MLPPSDMMMMVMIMMIMKMIMMIVMTMVVNNNDNDDTYIDTNCTIEHSSHLRSSSILVIQFK